MALITWQSDYLSHLGATAADEDRLTALIASASNAIERYTHRYFERAERDQVFYNRTWDILLPAYPIDYVARVCIQPTDVLTIRATGEVATFGVGESALNLRRVVSGVSSSTALSFATYPTLAALAAAMPTGFTATVASGYGAYPSADLVRKQGNCKYGAALAIWIDGSGTYHVDAKRGILSLRGQSPLHQWLADSEGFEHDQVRVVWSGGYATVPDDLQDVCAQLVAAAFKPNKSGLVQSESLGEYSYSVSIADVERLPITARRVLQSYKDRVL